MADDLIARYIELVSPYDGIGVQADRDRYLDLIAAGEDQATQEGMAKDSGCALVVRGFWRMLGVTDRRLHPRYVPGKAVEWLVAIARERDAWVAASPDRLPGIGDMVLVGGDKTADGGVEHVYTTLEITPDPRVIHSIDGGQVDVQGKQIIRKKQRTWQVRSGGIWDVVVQGTDPGSAAHGGRRVKGWIDLSAVMAREAGQR